MLKRLLIRLTEVSRTLENGRGLAVALAHAASEDYQGLTPELRTLLVDFEDSKFRLHFIDMSSNFNGLDEQYQSPTKLERLRASIFDKFNALSRRVRDYPELHFWWAPPPTLLFQKLACDGPIIVVNSSSFRNDIILVTTSEVTSFQIGHQSPNVAPLYDPLWNQSPRALAVVFSTAICRDDKDGFGGLYDRNIGLISVLEWLWDFVVERVCQELQLLATRHKRRNIPRIWWLPTGYFTPMPFHAAARFSSRSGDDSIMGRAISSYISSFRMLIWARSRSENLEKVRLDGMIVSMTPLEEKRSPKQSIFVRTAREEADAVEEEAQDISWLRKENPSAADIVAELPSKSYVHFCCHGEIRSRGPVPRAHLNLFVRAVETK